MKTTRMIWLVCAGALLWAWPTVAKDKRGKALASPKAMAEGAPATPWVKGLENERAASPGTGPQPDVRWRFSDEERGRIRAYAGSYGTAEEHGSKRLPPGLAKKVSRGGKLPPGWQKKCVVGERMPPEVYELCHPLPPELVVKLPPPPEPTITIAIGGKVVRLLKATLEILDVFDVHVNF